MTRSVIPGGATAASRLPETFSAWRERHAAAGVPPIVAVAGSRGKTTVVRVLDAMFRASGLRTALWTDHGVEVDGRRQRGELVPWSRALARVGDGSVDVAVQELDWATVHAVGLPTAVYPMVVVTNLCLNSAPCLAGSDGRLAIGSLVRVRNAVRSGGTLILSGEDGAVASLAAPDADTIIAAVSRDNPIIRDHLESGGVGAWSAANELRVGTLGDWRRVAELDRMPLAGEGALLFQVSNALLAAASGVACGVKTETIVDALRSFPPLDSWAPGSFNVVPCGGATVIVDRPAPSWFLRPALRAIAHLRPTRLVTVVGHAVGVPDEDLTETGRLLGRSGGVLILHSVPRSSTRATLLKNGIVANDVPPVVLHVRSERQAVQRALEMLRDGDVVFAISDRPPTVLRAVERAAEAARIEPTLDDPRRGPAENGGSRRR